MSLPSAQSAPPCVCPCRIRAPDRLCHRLRKSNWRQHHPGELSGDRLGLSDLSSSEADHNYSHLSPSLHLCRRSDIYLAVSYGQTCETLLLWPTNDQTTCSPIPVSVRLSVCLCVKSSQYRTIMPLRYHLKIPGGWLGNYRSSTPLVTELREDNNIRGPTHHSAILLYKHVA